VSQTKTIKCEACEGYGRVAMITHGPRLFGDIYNKPLAVTYAKAHKMLSEYRGSDAGALSMFVNNLARNLEVMPCPNCKATGIAFTLTFGEPIREDPEST